ncbi:MAG: TIGR00730 family Rossman fold protein [Pseudoflavonifractor sp.]|nr:TIGR00730 family Rossman fold protein [Pseudoflavonifractor sp.]
MTMQLDLQPGEGICVYGASSSRIPAVYVDAAREVGRLVGLSGRPLINGAGRGGLMAAATEGATVAGGQTVGVIPRFMIDNGWQHPSMTRLIVTSDMHRRKETMARLAHGAIALPGGYGTFEELLEIITWRQLGLYNGNVVILNTDGYYDPLLEMFARARSQGFITEGHGRMWAVASTPAEAVEVATAPVEVTHTPSTVSKY